MPGGGLEPPLSKNENKILSLARLPFRHPGYSKFKFTNKQIHNFQLTNQFIFLDYFMVELYHMKSETLQQRAQEFANNIPEPFRSVAIAVLQVAQLAKYNLTSPYTN